MLKIVIASLIAAAPFAASAQTRQIVSHADLDLTRPGDVAKFRHRIAQAIENVCGSYAGVEASQADDVTRCRADAVAHLPRRVAALMNRRHMQLAAK